MNPSPHHRADRIHCPQTSTRDWRVSFKRRRVDHPAVETEGAGGRRSTAGSAASRSSCGRRATAGWRSCRRSARSPGARPGSRRGPRSGRRRGSDDRTGRHRNRVPLGPSHHNHGCSTSQPSGELNRTSRPSVACNRFVVICRNASPARPRTVTTWRVTSTPAPASRRRRSSRSDWRPIVIVPSFVSGSGAPFWLTVYRGRPRSCLEERAIAPKHARWEPRLPGMVQKIAAVSSRASSRAATPPATRRRSWRCRHGAGRTPTGPHVAGGPAR